MVKITVRVSWSSRDDRRTAVRIAEEIARVYKARKYHVKVSEVYPNRKNTGGRIYITIERKNKKKTRD